LLLIAGILAGLFLIVLFVIAVVILLKRRKQGKETEIELRLLPKYFFPNKQIRLMNKINSGGFGVVWKARYKGQTVAIKLIRMDKERSLKVVNMVVDRQLDALLRLCLLLFQ
jgi:TRAP-type C4-dicarboxylate transport system permease large subunit